MYVIKNICRAVARGGLWGLQPPPQCLAEQLTLSQPGGQIMPTTVLQAPSNFQTLRRPCHGKPKISSIFHYERMPDVSIASVFWAHKDIQKMLLQKSFYPIILSFPTSHWRQIKFLEERLDTLPVKMFGPFWSVWSKTALAEVGVSLPWWCPTLVLPAPGYWSLFLNLIIFS